MQPNKMQKGQGTKTAPKAPTLPPQPKAAPGGAPKKQTARDVKVAQGQIPAVTGKQEQAIRTLGASPGTSMRGAKPPATNAGATRGASDPSPKPAPTEKAAPAGKQTTAKKEEKKGLLERAADAIPVIGNNAVERRQKNKQSRRDYKLEKERIEQQGKTDRAAERNDPEAIAARGENVKNALEAATELVATAAPALTGGATMGSVPGQYMPAEAETQPEPKPSEGLTTGQKVAAGGVFAAGVALLTKLARLW